MQHPRIVSTIALALAVSGVGAGVALTTTAGGADTGAHQAAVHHQSVTTVTVPARRSWTYTSIYVSQGQTVTIAATGTINVGQGVAVGPIGKTFNSSRCGYDAYRSAYGFVAPGVNCWALVFSVGSGYPAFATGSSITFVSPVSDYLQLGVNDNYFNDNSGSFKAKITLQ